MNQKRLSSIIIGVILLIGLAGYFVVKQKEQKGIGIDSNCKTGEIIVRFQSDISYNQASSVLSKYNLTPQDSFYKPLIHAFTKLSPQSLEILANRIKQYPQVDNVRIREDLKSEGGLDIYFVHGTDRDMARKIELEAGVPFAPNILQLNNEAHVRVPVGSEEKISDQVKSEQSVEIATPVCTTF